MGQKVISVSWMRSFICTQSTVLLKVQSLRMQDAVCVPLPLGVHSVYQCPKLDTEFCAVRTSWQRLQWLPAVKPSRVQVGGIAGSDTTLWLGATPSPGCVSVAVQRLHVAVRVPTLVQLASPLGV